MCHAADDGLEERGVPRHNAARSESIEPGPNAFPLVVGLDHPPGPGWHRLLLVESGFARLEGGASAVTLPTRSLALLPSTSPSRVLKGAGAMLRGCSFGRSLVDPLALGEEVVEDLDLSGARSATAAPRFARLPPDEFRDARALFSYLERESRDRKPGADAMLRIKLIEAILVLYRALLRTPAVGGQSALEGRLVSGGRPPAESEAPFRLEEVQRYLQERYADSLTLPGIAARFGFNPSYFSRRFHREAGVPLVQYLNGLRIGRSCVLLKRTDLGVLEIALSVGYNNLSHFNRYFRKLVGLSPREYRARDRRDSSDRPDRRDSSDRRDGE